MMSVRDCYRRIALFDKAERIPNLEGGISPRTIAIWRSEGLPEGVTPAEFFGLDRLEIYRGVNYGPLPGVQPNYSSLDEYRDLLTAHGYEIGYDDQGCMVGRRNGQESHISHNSWGRVSLHLKKHEVGDEYAESAFELVQGAFSERSEWEALRGQFNPDGQARLGGSWQDKVKE